ncbi:MAG TPA: DUF6600 domain-containing protein [Bacteroidota bacterium]
MKLSMIVTMLAAGVLLSSRDALSAPSIPQEDAPEAVNLFYADLTPYGEWIQFEPGMYAWHPLAVDPGWRPYMRGRWVWSDYGWYWVTAEPFGWATYHYGRWYLDDFYGWIWIPDTIWGPAWVEWRYNDDYVGWAPLPPYARFHVTVGIRFTERWVAPPVYWSFIAYNHFGVNHPYRDYVNESYTRRLISTTRSAGRYEVDQNRIINRGVSRTMIEGHIPNRLETAQVTETRDRGIERITRDGGSERVEIYRPRRTEGGSGNVRIQARRAETRPSLDIDRVDQYRSVIRPDARRGEENRGRVEQNIETPGREIQLPPGTERRNDRPAVRPERQSRYQQAFPAPRINKNPGIRREDGRDKGRSGGRGRDRF